MSRINIQHYRGMKKRLMDLIPKKPFEGTPVAVVREPNDYEKPFM